MSELNTNFEVFKTFGIFHRIFIVTLVMLLNKLDEVTFNTFRWINRNWNCDKQ